MKKITKLLLAIIFISIISSCEILLIRDVEVYNGTGYTIDELYIIPDSSFPYIRNFSTEAELAQYCRTWHSREEQTGYYDLYSYNYHYVDLDDISSWEDDFVLIAVDRSGRVYYETFSDYDSYIEIYSFNRAYYSL